MEHERLKKIERTLYLVRGLPGAGKSTFAKKISVNTFEADTYFYINGVYVFDSSRLREVHAMCQKAVENAMEESYDTNGVLYEDIVVSNTFTQEWEMNNYFILAKKYNYRVVSLIVENRHGNKSIHDCPDDKVELMRQRFSIKL